MTLVEKGASLLSALENSAFGRKFKEQVAREAAESLESERKTHGAAITALQKSGASKLAKLSDAQDAAFAAIKSAREQLTLAERAYNAAYVERAGFLVSNEREIERHRFALRTLADPRIDAAKRDIEALAEALRTASYDADYEEINTFHGPKRKLLATNYHLVQKRFAAINEARAALDSLAGSYVPTADLSAAIEAIVSAIPGKLDPATPKAKVENAEYASAA